MPPARDASAGVAELLQSRTGMLDVVVIGGGPAGLSAALMLGRARRRVVVCDAGTPRNARSHTLHGFLTRDGMQPAELLRHGRDEICRYGVEWRPGRVATVARRHDSFEVALEDGEHLHGRKLLIATGVSDDLPAVDGLADCYGRSVHHCPYCDGWEWRDARLAVLGPGRAGAGLALSLLTWSTDVRLFTNGPSRLTTVLRRQLDAQGVIVHEDPVDGVDHVSGRLRAVRLRTGDSMARDALFFTTAPRQQDSLAARLGCEFTRKGVVRTDRYGRTCVPGLFVVGDASFDVQFVVVAAAEGAKAAVLINRQFQAEAGRVLA